MQANAIKQESLDAFIDRLIEEEGWSEAIRLSTAAKSKVANEICPPETAKRLPYPKDIYYFAGKVRIFKTREWLHYLLTRNN